MLLVNLLAFQTSFAFSSKYEVKQKDIYEGYIIEKVWLTEFAVPQVTITDITWAMNASLPKDAKVSHPEELVVTIGMERKQAFAVVRIPAYMAGTQANQVNRVSSFTLNITEQPQPKDKSRNKFNDVPVSVLATGTWYKIGITKTGFYKIDNSFLSTMGVKAADINPDNIRICGNGGNMLSEYNAIPRAADLTENSTLIINNNNNGVFDNGEAIIFYGVGPTAWAKDSLNKRFKHTNNLYTDTAFYFVSFNSGSGKHITQQAALSGGNTNVTTFDYYDVHELDLVNPAALGKNWYGEQFNTQLGNTTQTFPFDLGTSVAQAYVAVSFAATTAYTTCKYDVSINGNAAGSSTFYLSTTGDNVMDLNLLTGTTACNSQTANVSVTFTAPDGASNGYLNYIELLARRNLIINSDQMSFRDWLSVGAGNIATYSLQGANSNTSVWDITYPQTPVIMSGNLSGNAYQFTQEASRLHEFAAMNSTNLYTPKFVGQVATQNLHGTGQVDMIIVTYPGFINQAKQLKTYHESHDNLKVVVATTSEIYNEFSSGGQDISAIRDFARMFYTRAIGTADMPKYLLLFGGASYDYKNRLANNSNYVPVFESAESYNDLNSFCTDDFYGFLDDSEYIENDSFDNALDIGVGRLPARSVDDATAVVNKIMNYASAATLGPWRISSTIVADKGCNDPAGNHMQDADSMASEVRSSTNNLYNQEKIYVDAIPIISTPAGARCPNANAALNEQVFNGTFLINYNGHGNPTVWSSERILTSDDFNNWNNMNMLPFMVTATCDFGQFDHPQFVSSAEQMVVRKEGGVVAILTTTQAVYAYYNHELNVQYLDAQFTRNTDMSWNTFGDASRIGKNVTYTKPSPHDAGEIANFRKFSLLGDPAVTPDFPKYNVRIDSIKDGYTHLQADTVKALGAYDVNGSVRDFNGNIMTGFNGIVFVTFYDKQRSITTISGCADVYKMQDNIVYKGRVTVTNGLFSFSFITPKDINYSFGNGKISTYAHNGTIDAAGADSNIAVGGFSDHPVLSSEPPLVKPYINDSLFLNGGITGSNTSLFVTFYDKTGINVSGNDIGHDMTAVLDGSADAPYILNNYYQTLPNTYQHGFVSFPISGLTDGPHSIKVRAWDVNDNVGEGTVDFVVVDGQIMDIQQLGNYPNPFSGTTHFVFEHNHPDEELDINIGIFNIGGSLVKEIKEKFTPTGSRTADITWDGTDNGGNKLASGVYVYRLSLTTTKGFKTSAYQKLVIVR